MKKNLLISLFSLFLVTGCDTLRTSYDYDPKFNFNKLQNYALLGDKMQKDEFKIKDPLVNKHIAYAIEKQLSPKGYKLISTDQVDFYISWYGTVKNRSFKEHIRTYDNRYYNDGWRNSDYKSHRYPPNYGRSTTEVRDRTYNYEYKEGTLFIDILDGKTKELIWRGKAEDYLGRNYQQENISQRIIKAVSEILLNFPPQQAGAKTE